MLLFINKPQDGGEYIQFPTEVLVTVVLVMLWESLDSDTDPGMMSLIMCAKKGDLHMGFNAIADLVANGRRYLQEPRPKSSAEGAGFDESYMSIYSLRSVKSRVGILLNLYVIGFEIELDVENIHWEERFLCNKSSMAGLPH